MVQSVATSAMILRLEILIRTFRHAIPGINDQCLEVAEVEFIVLVVVGLDEDAVVVVGDVHRHAVDYRIIPSVTGFVLPPEWVNFLR